MKSYFTVTLPQAAGTGYSWIVLNQPSWVRTVGHHFQNAATAITPGAGRFMTFVFSRTSNKKRGGNITFGLKRPWERFVVQERTVQIPN